MPIKSNMIKGITEGSKADAETHNENTKKSKVAIVNVRATAFSDHENGLKTPIFGKNKISKIGCLDRGDWCGGRDLNPRTTKDKALNLAPLTRLDYPRAVVCDGDEINKRFAVR